MSGAVVSILPIHFVISKSLLWPTKSVEGCLHHWKHVTLGHLENALQINRSSGGGSYHWSSTYYVLAHCAGSLTCAIHSKPCATLASTVFFYRWENWGSGSVTHFRSLSYWTWTEIQTAVSPKPGLLSQTGLWRLSNSLNSLWASVSSSVKRSEVTCLVGLLWRFEPIAAQGPEAHRKHLNRGGGVHA